MQFLFSFFRPHLQGTVGEKRKYFSWIFDRPMWGQVKIMACLPCRTEAGEVIIILTVVFFIIMIIIRNVNLRHTFYITGLRFILFKYIHIIIIISWFYNNDKAPAFPLATGSIRAPDWPEYPYEYIQIPDVFVSSLIILCSRFAARLHSILEYHRTKVYPPSFCSIMMM